jgi:hypothetical protein
MKLTPRTVTMVAEPFLHGRQNVTAIPRFVSDFDQSSTLYGAGTPPCDSHRKSKRREGKLPPASPPGDHSGRKLLAIAEDGLVVDVGARLIITQQVLGEILHHPLVDVRLIIGVSVTLARKIEHIKALVSLDQRVHQS